jgi:DNA-binding transcriptional ArsR family regulator
LKRYQDITDPSLAKALAHPIRIRVLAALDNRVASPSELAEELNVSLGVISYHVRRLQSLKFLKLVKRVPRRGAVEHYYTTVAGPQMTNETWSTAPTIVKHAAVSSALDEIGAQASAAVNAGGFDYDDAHISRTPVIVDEKGWHAIASELDALIPRIEKIEAESRKRLLKSDHQDERPANVSLLLFSPAATTEDAEVGHHSQARRREPQSSGASRSPRRAPRKS